MNKSITQDNLNDNQISKSIRRFFTRFHLSSALKAAKASSGTYDYKVIFNSTDGNYSNILINEGKVNIAHKHITKTVTTKATLSKDGKIATVCAVCGKTLSSKKIARISSVKLSATTYKYDGKTKTPSVTVKDSAGKKLVKNRDYTVSYASGRKSAGQYSVKITFKGNYSGSKTLTFKILPKATSVSSLKAGKKSLTVKVGKQSSASGYEVRYSTKSNLKGAKTFRMSGTSKKLTKLSAKKYYYVQVRSYKTVKINGKSTRIYSAWSKTKKAKTK